MASKYVCLVAGVVVFGLGFSLAYWRGEAKIQAIKATYETREKEVKTLYVKKLESEREQRVKDVDSLLKQLHESHDRERSLTRAADRLRNDLVARAKRPSTSTGACGACEVRLAGCARLLAEGVELSAEGAGLAERIAVRKDGLSDYAR